MKVPFVDLIGQYRQLQKPITRAIGSVLSRAEFIHGDEVFLFENFPPRFYQ